MNPISHILSPRSVAVVGASTDSNKIAGKPVLFLRKHGFKGAIYPVNPRVDAIDGLKCYPDVGALPESPDVAIVLLGADRAAAAVRELSARGTKSAIVLASGFGETGEDGARRQSALLDAAGPMRLLGPNTIGLVNLTERVPLSASGALEMDAFPTGSIGVVSQSGGVLGALLSRAAGRGIGLSKLISTGNEVDLKLGDFVDALADDPATHVIALYVESIRDPQRFRTAALKAAAAGKPIVAYKVGRSEAGAVAAASHTGAMAGSDKVYDAFFDELGVIRASAFSDLLDIPISLAKGRKLRGNRVAILTSTGGAATLVSDNLGLHGFETPHPDEATAQRLRALLPGDQAVLDRNPIDVTLAGLQPNVLRGAIEALLESPSYDALTIIVGSSGVAAPDLMAGAIKPCLANTEKPVIAYVSPHAPDAAARLTANDVPAFTVPESCAVALAGLRHATSLRAPTTVKRAPVPAPPPSLPIGSLDEAQSKGLFAHFGVPCVREKVVTTTSEATAAANDLGGRVVLKLVSNEITHKSDVGGVIVGVTPETMASAIDRMMAEVGAKTGTRPSRFLVQEMITGGTELILGYKRDPLGGVILLGAGGTATEIFKDTTMRLLPPSGALTMEEAKALPQQLKSWPLLNGYRGRPKADLEALAAAIVAFSAMAQSLGDQLVEAEINPIFALPEGQGARAADGVVVVSG